MLTGDLTDAYSKKVQQATRSFVFLNLHDEKVPAALIVFDRVVSADAKFRKYWLLHTQEEPRIDGASAIVDCTQHDQRGRLTLDVLLPADTNRQLTSVGGPGKEYWVFGTNYANDIEPRQLERSSLEPGQWRIELSPRAASCDDSFLTVMQVTDRAAPDRLPVRLVELRDRVGSYIERPDGSRLVLFRRDGQRSSRPGNDRRSRSWKNRRSGHGPHARRIARRRANESNSHEIRVSQELGAAWFEASPGTWHLEASEAAGHRAVNPHWPP